MVDADATIIKTKARFVINKLSILPIISVGLVRILVKSSVFSFKKASTPIKQKKKKILNLIINLNYLCLIHFHFLHIEKNHQK